MTKVVAHSGEHQAVYPFPAKQAHRSTVMLDGLEVKFDKAWKLANGNYEIRGRDAKGKAREVESNAMGQVVEED